MQRKPYPEDWRSQDLGSKGQPNCMNMGGHCGGVNELPSPFLLLVTSEAKLSAFND